MINITFPGEPISKSNATLARFNWKTKKSEVYIPEKFMMYEELLKQSALEYMQKYRIEPFLKDPVSLTITYWLSEHRIKDLPNLPKTTCDALNGVVFGDDSQIVEMQIFKKFSKDNPRVEITVSRPDNWLAKLLASEYSFPKTMISDEVMLTLKAQEKLLKEAAKKEKAKEKDKVKKDKEKAGQTTSKRISTSKTRKRTSKKKAG